MGKGRSCVRPCVLLEGCWRRIGWRAVGVLIGAPGGGGVHVDPNVRAVGGASPCACQGGGTFARFSKGTARGGPALGFICLRFIVDF